MKAESTTEKASVNINVSNLALIDLLVDNGYYSNRSDFINQAVRQQLQQESTIIEQIKSMQLTNERNHWFLGIVHISPKYLEEPSLCCTSYELKGYGLLIIDPECSTEILYKRISKINVKGRVICDDEIKRHYGIK